MFMADMRLGSNLGIYTCLIGVVDTYVQELIRYRRESFATPMLKMSFSAHGT